MQNEINFYDHCNEFEDFHDFVKFFYDTLEYDVFK